MVIKIRKRIALQDQLMWIGLFCVVSYALLEHVSIPIPAFSAVKMPLLYIGGLCAAFQVNTFLRNILKRRYFGILMVLFLMCIFLVISMFHNHNAVYGYSPVRNTVRLILYLLELFILMIVFAEKGQGRAAMKLVYHYVLVLVVLTDFLMFSGLVRFGSSEHEKYLLGTKFTVVYMHLNLLALWMVQYRDTNDIKYVSKWKILAVIILLILVSVRVDCMTGVIGDFIFAVLLMWMSVGTNKVRRLASPTLLVFCIIASTMFAFIVGFIVEIPFVTYLIEETFRRSTTLTGRLNIYHDYVEKIKNNWILGYGYGSGNLVSMRLFGYADVQNAILQWVLQSGILVTSMLVTLISGIVNQINKYDIGAESSIEPVIALVYTYIALGTVEITYSMSFILWVALIFMTVNDQIT